MTKRLTLAIVLTCLGLQAHVPQRPGPRKHPEAHRYMATTFGRKAVVRSAGGAAFGQMINRPHQWGRGPGGFGKRLASGFGHHVVSSSVSFGVGKMLHEQTRYTRAQGGFGAHFKSALGNTFLVYHRGSNRRHVAAGRISGAVAGGMVSRLWQPAAMRTVASGVGSAGTSLGVDFGVNMAREYYPRHKKVAQVRRGRTRRG